jgi:asparagine synthase (glutamine-hydrolysing)
MCGITGWLDQRIGDVTPRSEALLTRMRDSITHRGPDDSGSWFGNSGKVALASRRLSILDLSERGHQPMVSSSADVAVTYNGELYNHLEIRALLEQQGYRFNSSCDTEVVLYAFQEWGIGCLSRFKGQFALAAWNGQSQTLYLARDRVGIQPLYFYSANSLLVFGSEIRAILEHPEVSPAVNVAAMYQYFSMHTAVPPSTLLNDVYIVPAGAYVRCQIGKTPQLIRYWSLLDEIGKQDLQGETSQALSGRLRDTLSTAVRRRLQSERPMGLFLSGGLDSTSILACTSESGAQELRSFSIGYTDSNTGENIDEFNYARIAAQAFGSEHVLVRSDPSRLPEFMDTCDLPPENLGEFWLWEMSEVASQHGVRVVLHGDGADELFLGYEFHWEAIAQRERVLKSPESVYQSTIDSGIPLDRWAASKGPADRDRLADLVFWGGGVHPSLEYDQSTYFGESLLQAPRLLGSGLDTTLYRPMSESASVLNYIEDCYAQAQAHRPALDFRQRMQYIEFIYKLPEVFLRRAERSTMKHSVEVRLPFLDEDVVSLAVNMPTAALKEGRDLKHPLKEAMRGLVPEQIRTRQKQGFGVSFSRGTHQWLSTNDWFSHHLFESPFADLGFISTSYLSKRYHELRQPGSPGFETLLWKHVFASAWFDHHVRG